MYTERIPMQLEGISVKVTDRSLPLADLMRVLTGVSVVLHPLGVSLVLADLLKLEKPADLRQIPPTPENLSAFQRGEL